MLKLCLHFVLCFARTLRSEAIEVTIDGVRINIGWEYDISSNSVVFDNDFIPAGGSTIEVFYERLPLCES